MLHNNSISSTFSSLSTLLVHHGRDHCGSQPVMCSFSCHSLTHLCDARVWTFSTWHLYLRPAGTAQGVDLLQRVAYCTSFAPRECFQVLPDYGSQRTIRRFFIKNLFWQIWHWIRLLAFTYKTILVPAASHVWEKGRVVSASYSHI